MMRHIIALFLIAHPATVLGIRNGTTSYDQSSVALWHGDAQFGSGTLVSPHLILTSGKSVSPNLAHSHKFVMDHRGDRVPDLFPSISGRIINGEEFGPLLIENPVTNETYSAEGPVLLLIDPKDSPKFKNVSFPKLPQPGDTPGSRTGNQAHLRIVGYGVNGTVTHQRLEGSVSYGGMLPLFSKPQGAFLFFTEHSSDSQELSVGDSGGGLIDDRTLYGIHVVIPKYVQALATSEFRNLAGVHFWMGSPQILAWIEKTAFTWKVPIEPSTDPKP